MNGIRKPNYSLYFSLSFSLSPSLSLALADLFPTAAVPWPIHTLASSSRPSAFSRLPKSLRTQYRSGLY
uniref:Putative secreted protein n=1 Tax=Anopheles triannulatus TaxID=58253 RepID=A0A2M4B7K9_9DIPT